MAAEQQLIINIPAEWMAEIKLQCKSMGIPISAAEGRSDGPSEWARRMVAGALKKQGAWPEIEKTQRGRKKSTTGTDAGAETEPEED